MKKANISPSVMSVLVIAVAVVVIVVLTETGLFEQANENKINQDCRTSVRQNAFIRVPGRELIDNINCPTQQKTSKETEPEKIKAEMADLMVDCWQNFGEGKLELFRTERNTETTFCAVCYIVDYKNTGQQVTGFIDYMAVNKPFGKDVSYFEYLTNAKVTSEILQQSAQASEKDIIDTSKKYAIVFTYPKEVKYWDKVTGTFTGTAGGFAAGSAIVVGAAAAGVLTGGVALMVVPAFLGATAAGGGFLGFISTPWSAVSGGDPPAVARVEFKPEYLAALKCQELPAKHEK